MSNIIEFRKELFDYFFTHDDERARKIVKNTMEAVGEKIQEKLFEIDRFYSGYDVGRLQFDHDHCWVAFGPNKDKKEYRKWAHQTISIDALGIEIFVNIELKNATDLLKTKVFKNSHEFKKLILNLLQDDTFTIRIEERRNKQASIYDYFLLAQFESNYFRNPPLNNFSFENLKTLLNQIPLPYTSIRTRIKGKEVVEMSKTDNGILFINEVVRIMSAFQPLVKFINEPEYN